MGISALWRSTPLIYLINLLGTQSWLSTGPPAQVSGSMAFTQRLDQMGVEVLDRASSTDLNQAWHLGWLILAQIDTPYPRVEVTGRTALVTRQWLSYAQRVAGIRARTQSCVLIRSAL